MRVAGPDEYDAAMAWLKSWDTGMSSETIWRVMMGETPSRPSIPYDPSDFGRCYRLLKTVPSWRGRMAEMGQFKAWKPFVEAWDELTALYEDELKRADGMAPRTYIRLHEVRGEPFSSAEIERLMAPRTTTKKRSRR